MGILGRLADRLERLDAWVNPFTGFGTERDKTTAGEYVGARALDDTQLSALFHFDAIAQRIVKIVPGSALRQGLPTIKCADNADAATYVTGELNRLGALKAFRNAAIWGRAFGGAVIFVGANDGRSSIEPLDKNAVRSVDFLQVYDRRRVIPYSFYRDPANVHFDTPEIYTVTGASGGVANVHASRLIRFGGALTSDQDRQELNHWDYSVLQACYDYLRAFNDANKAAEHLLSDASQGVFKLKGLISALAEGNMRDLLARVQLLDMSRGVARAIMVDADSEESFTKVATSFGGVADMLDRAANNLSAASGVPVTLLMGQAPAGLNATGESDIRTWYDEIRSYQANDMGPLVHKVAELIAIAGGYRGVTITEEWLPLWQETAKESAERRKLVADTDAIYIANEVLTPEEVALNRFRPEGWNPDTTIDTRARETPALPPEATPGGVRPGAPSSPTTGPSPHTLGSNPLGTS